MSVQARATSTVALALLLLTACFGGNSEVTESGMGLPVITADFPSSVAAGSTHPLHVTVENPGPGDMSSVAIAFVLVGPRAGQSDLPAALVALGSEGNSPSIVMVEPSPNGVSPDAVVYTFEGIPEGGSAEYTFDVKAPDEAGVAANSLQVYDGQEIDRAAGVRVETTVER